MTPGLEGAAKGVGFVSDQAAGLTVPGLLLAGCLGCIGLLAYMEKKREADRKRYEEDSQRREDQLVEIHKEHIVEKQKMQSTMASLDRTLTHFGTSLSEHNRALDACIRTWPQAMRDKDVA